MATHTHTHPLTHRQLFNRIILRLLAGRVAMLFPRSIYGRTRLTTIYGGPFVSPSATHTLFFLGTNCYNQRSPSHFAARVAAGAFFALLWPLKRKVHREFCVFFVQPRPFAEFIKCSQACRSHFAALPSAKSLRSKYQLIHFRPFAFLTSFNLTS